MTSSFGPERHCQPPSEPINELDAHVGVRLGLRRSMLGLAEADLAKLVSLDAAEINDIEAGRRRAGATELVALAKALGVAVSWFYECLPAADGESDAPAARPPPTVDAAKRMLLGYYEHMSPEMRAKLIMIASVLAMPKPGPSNG